MKFLFWMNQTIYPFKSSSRIKKGMFFPFLCPTPGGFIVCLFEISSYRLQVLLNRH
jgi:hypothetical protein